MAQQEQYFSAQPQSPDIRGELQVTLRGQAMRVEVSHGVFSAKRLDLGTSVLLRLAPDPPAHGTLLDLGCGWGPVALTLGAASPHAHVYAVDINERALELTRRNAELNHLSNITALTPEEALAQERLMFDCIWSNPPIRIGKEALHAMLLTWLPRLKLGASAYLVVQRNLGADSLTAWLNTQVGLPSMSARKAASSKGFRIIEVQRQA